MNIARLLLIASCVTISISEVHSARIH